MNDSIFNISPNFKGTISAVEMNNMIKEMQDILKKVYNKAEIVKTFYDVLSRATLYSYWFLANRITNIENNIAIISGLYNNMTETGVASKIEIIDALTTPYSTTNITQDTINNILYLGYISEIDHMLYAPTNISGVYQKHASTELIVDGELITDPSDLRCLFLDNNVNTFAIFDSNKYPSNKVSINVNLKNHRQYLNTVQFKTMPVPGANIVGLKVDGVWMSKLSNRMAWTTTNYSCSNYPFITFLNNKNFNGNISFDMHLIGVGNGYAVGFLNEMKCLYREFYDTGEIIYHIYDADTINTLTSLSCEYYLLENLKVPDYINIQIATDSNFINVIYNNSIDPFPLPYGSRISVGNSSDLYIKIVLNKYEFYTPSVKRLILTYT